jgi:hypothetical protein
MLDADTPARARLPCWWAQTDATCTDSGLLFRVEREVDPPPPTDMVIRCREGLIHVSEFDDQAGGEKIELEVGTNYQMKIIKLSPSERKIGLSIRALTSGGDWESYQETEGTGTATLGDHFRNR